MAKFNVPKIAAPVDADHYVRTLTWLKNNVPELSEMSLDQWLLRGRIAVTSTDRRRRKK